MEVRLDPTITVAPADLQSQNEITLKLRDMQSSVNDSLRTLDSIKAQLQFIERTVKDRSTEPPKELTETIATYTKQIEDAESLARPGGLALKAANNLLIESAVSSSPGDGTNAAPTAPQRDTSANCKLNSAASERSQSLHQRYCAN